MTNTLDEAIEAFSNLLKKRNGDELYDKYLVELLKAAKAWNTLVKWLPPFSMSDLNALQKYKDGSLEVHLMEAITKAYGEYQGDGDEHNRD